ncbi:hypothetical protein TNCV_4660501 [Trichonephila clavipes]|uniref:Uncharacterized protein n=1 Tax=Trichonephila clavipes TaxID=2585209 RepID=A0A8X6V8H8_TRICX|nr:hypothetical protein TNCV_4660501 [Trichonephila clavipes]
MLLAKKEVNTTSLFKCFKRTAPPLFWRGGQSLLKFHSRFQLAGEIQPLVSPLSLVVGVMSDERTLHYFRGARGDMNGKMPSVYGSRSCVCEAGKRYNTNFQCRICKRIRFVSGEAGSLGVVLIT